MTDLQEHNDMTSKICTSGNKGEWSEFYTFCYLLNMGILKTADKNLNPNTSAFLPVIRIIRREDECVKDYCPDGGIVKIYIDKELVKEVPKTEFEKTVSILYQKIKEGKTNDSDFQNRMHKFMMNIHCIKIKANSTSKKDIDIQIHDVNTNQTPIQGFSIKSYVGNDPTLLNAGKTTNFTFRIGGCNDDLMDNINGIDTKNKIFNRMDAILGAGCSLEFIGMDSDRFKKNLQMVDSSMPQIMAQMLLVHYTEGKSRLSDVVSVLEKNDPFEMDNKGYYIYKMKTVLCAFALGMVPSEKWTGIEDANGGYIIVKEDGDIVCFFLYNRNVFEEYLLECTKFERPSTSRHEYMTIYKEGDEYHIKLNLQIRFTKPRN